MTGNSSHTLEEREHALHRLVGRYASHELLRLISRALLEQEMLESALHDRLSPPRKRLPPFVAAGLADLAMRVSNPHRGRCPTTVEFDHLIQCMQEYLLLDPVVFDTNANHTFLNSPPILLVLRTAAAQIPSNVNIYARHARSLLLFQDTVKLIAGKPGVPLFDFEDEFRRLFSITLDDLMSVSLVAWSAARAMPLGFTGEYFARAKSMGMRLPDEETTLSALDIISADPVRLRDSYQELRQQDRRFRMYDGNPIFRYPLLRPFKSDGKSLTEGCRLIAPLPDLITHKITTGLYHELKHALGKRFTRWFGYLFEAYIGEVLGHSIPGSAIWSETEIRRNYSELQGRVPDWVIMDGSVCILIECKSTEFYRDIVAECDEQAIKDNLTQTRSGLCQLHAFMHAILNKEPGLEAFHHCSRVLPVLMTFEPLYLMNSGLGRQFLDDQLAAEGIPTFPWQILDMQSLEILQPHLNAGYGFSRALDMIGASDPNNIVGYIAESTGLTYKDSFMSAKFTMISEQLAGGL